MQSICESSCIRAVANICACLALHTSSHVQTAPAPLPCAHPNAPPHLSTAQRPGKRNTFVIKTLSSEP
ncbi:hypothetical protein RSAG8_02575, partial [Rhizoctonia solani AG-8 WAC10335]